MPSQARHNNQLTLAVAGSRKTQGIVDACAAAARGERVLIVTYTRANQLELVNRLTQKMGDHANVNVSGWFAFLIRHFVRPFLPFVFPSARVQGFDPVSKPNRYMSSTNLNRYFNANGEVLKAHLPQLAFQAARASNGAPLQLLARLYDHVYIDEVQDLCGWDLEILRLLMTSPIPLSMVGDVRQAILATNAEEQKNRGYKFMGIWRWFQEQERRGVLEVQHRSDTWRCRPEIAAFADSLFGPGWGFQKTTSRNNTVTAHDGIFLVHPRHVDAYVAAFAPLPLRWSKSSAKPYDHLEFMNFGASKGLSHKRVLVFPTANMEKLIQQGRALEDQAAAHLYVAVTRAEQSVAFAISTAGQSKYQYWSPNDRQREPT